MDLIIGYAAELLAGDALLQRLDHFETEQITVTGFAGGGFTLVTDRLGPEVYAGKLPVAWDTKVLVVMRGQLRDDGAAMLKNYGVPDPQMVVRSLAIGQALVIVRT